MCQFRIYDSVNSLSLAVLSFFFSVVCFHSTNIELWNLSLEMGELGGEVLKL